jgi:hypothetical protein
MSLGRITLLLLLPAVCAAAEAPGIDSQPLSFSPKPAVWIGLSALAAGADQNDAPAVHARTVPTFEDSFTYAGQTYSYQMVGTNPRLSKRRTVVPTVIVPLRFVFADGSKFEPGKTTAQLRRSPIFRRAAFASGITQYGDAIQRAEFWPDTQNTRYHVVLRPTVLPTVTVKVPAGHGMAATSSFGGTVGVLSEADFSGQVVPAVINHFRLPPSKLVIFWSYNVDLLPPSGPGAILGEHSAGTDQTGTYVWTWAWSSWHTADTAPPEEADVAVLSHEISEWYNDPFVSNVVPAWQALPSYPCNPVLEVGDPLVGTTFTSNGYHLQDEAFLSWFARQVPSTAMGGMYSFLGTLTAPPAVCTGG